MTHFEYSSFDDAKAASEQLAIRDSAAALPDASGLLPYRTDAGRHPGDPIEGIVITTRTETEQFRAEIEYIKGLLDRGASLLPTVVEVDDDGTVTTGIDTQRLLGDPRTRREIDY